MEPHSEVVWTLFIGRDLKRTLINLIGLRDFLVAGSCQPHRSGPSRSARMESGLEPQSRDFIGLDYLPALPSSFPTNLRAVFFESKQVMLQGHS